MAALTLRAQPGPQRLFAAAWADIVIYGGAAGGGKSWALVYEAARNARIKGYTAALFRRTRPQLIGGGSIWEESKGIYPLLGGVPNLSELYWRFPSGSTIEFNSMQYVDDLESYLSKQYACILIDQLEQFEGEQFWGLFGRNRSTCRVQPYMRGACNPDPDCFLYMDGAGLIAWWIGEDGYPIPERCGVVRWFVKDGDLMVWADSEAELRTKAPQIFEFNPHAAVSITFIAATLADNEILTTKDPKYMSKLMALSNLKKEQLLLGNWKIRPKPGDAFQRSWVEIVDEAPKEVAMRCRAWDKAGTKPHASNPNPNYTAGVKMSRTHDGVEYIEHVERFRENPGEVDSRIKKMADQDGHDCTVAMWKDPGQAGKKDAESFTRMFPLHEVHIEPASGSKQTFFAPFSSQAQNGNVRVVRGPWNEDYFRELEALWEGDKDDQADATSLAHIVCSEDDDLEGLRALASM